MSLRFVARKLMNFPRLLGGDIAEEIAEAIANPGDKQSAPPAYARTFPTHADLTAGAAKRHAQGRALVLQMTARCRPRAGPWVWCRSTRTSRIKRIVCWICMA